MRIFGSEQKEEPGKLVVDKALERVKVKAQWQARAFLCLDCLDKRCLNDSICRSFMATTESMAWEMLSAGCELN